jgi:hypothetical protein
VAIVGLVVAVTIDTSNDGMVVTKATSLGSISRGSTIRGRFISHGNVVVAKH